jgi:hypothetical protein
MYVVEVSCHHNWELTLIKYVYDTQQDAHCEDMQTYPHRHCAHAYKETCASIIPHTFNTPRHIPHTITYFTWLHTCMAHEWLLLISNVLSKKRYRPKKFLYYICRRTLGQQQQ